MGTIQKGPNPLLPSLLVLIGTTTETWHFKPCPTHRTFSMLTYWRDLQVCSLHPPNTLSEWDSGTAIGPSSSDTLLLPPVWHHKLYPVTLSGFTWRSTNSSATFCMALRGEANQHHRQTEAQLSSCWDTQLWEIKILQIGSMDCAAKAKLTSNEDMCTSNMNLYLHIYVVSHTNMHLCMRVLQKM